jgi:hypothetical protein
MDTQLDRRVSATEFAQLMGMTVEGLRLRRKAKLIPEPRRDYPQGRPFWLLSEVQAVVEGRAAATHTQHEPA